MFTVLSKKKKINEMVQKGTSVGTFTLYKQQITVKPHLQGVSTFLVESLRNWQGGPEGHEQNLNMSIQKSSIFHLVSLILKPVKEKASW